MNLRRAFTLIEALVAMSLSAVLLSAVGFSLRPSQADGARMRIAQTAVATILRAARNEAIARQVNTRVLVCAVEPPDGVASQYLRFLVAVRENEDPAAPWISFTESQYLPDGICVVPPILPPSHLTTGVNWEVGALSPLSTLGGPVAGPSSIGQAYAIEFSADGRVDPLEANIVIASARTGFASLPQFENPAGAVGISIRNSGLIRFGDATSGF